MRINLHAEQLKSRGRLQLDNETSSSPISAAEGWNRARWDLARDFFTREPPNRLDGGLEVDAWYTYPLERPFVSDRSWWITKKPYVITLGVLPGHRIIARAPTRTWLPFGDGYIYLLQRE